MGDHNADREDASRGKENKTAACKRCLVASGWCHTGNATPANETNDKTLKEKKEKKCKNRDGSPLLAAQRVAHRSRFAGWGGQGGRG